MQTSGTFPQLSNNERKALKAQLTPRKAAPKAKVASKKSKSKEPRDPRTANSRKFGTAAKVPLGLATRRARARKAAGR